MSATNATEQQPDVEFQRSQTRGPTREFKRAYKACILCRRSKAKCELSPAVDGGLPEGPCAKCRRERKHCEFTATRSASKRQKHNHDTAASDSSNEASNLGGDVDSGVALMNHSTPFSLPPASYHHQLPHNQDFTPGPGHNPTGSQTIGSTNARRDDDELSPIGSFPGPAGQNMPQRSVLNDKVMRTIVTSSNDALGILFQAVEDRNPESSRDSQTLLLDGEADADLFRGHGSPSQHRTPRSMISTSMSNHVPPEHLSSPSPALLKLWNRCRFVKQGWFSAREAVSYIDLFFRNCAPLSPILGDHFSNHSNHAALVTEEPLLCCTILTISSRMHILPGIGGASRADFIHGRLWQHLEHLISRVIFGQEKISTAKTRTMGTIESFLLMTEWHPRALHFPPQSDGWDCDLLSPDSPDDSEGLDDESALYRWREEVFEPARRSDRMSWMLLGAATSLAHELGIFGDGEAALEMSNAYQVRRLRVRMLLYVYVNQLSSRLGCTTLIPENVSHSVLDRSSLPLLAPQEQRWYSFMTCWVEITSMMETVTDMFFPSAVFTRQLLLSGRYKGLLKHFEPLLVQWYEKSIKLEGISSSFRDLLFIDYHYIRMYINSLSIQAIVERAISQTPSSGHGTIPSHLSDELLVTSFSASDYTLTSVVVDSCIQILQQTIALARTGQLRFAPVRISLRIVSASIFLLKAISIGARTTDLQSSLAVLDECIQALQSSAIDEMHLSARYATLIERHVARFRRNFAGGAKASRRFGNNNGSGNNGETAAADFGVGSLMGGMDAVVGQETFGMDGLVGGYGGVEFDDWLAQPFDPSFAPFGTGGGTFMSGLELSSLDFLWNLPT